MTDSWAVRVLYESWMAVNRSDSLWCIWRRISGTSFNWIDSPILLSWSFHLSFSFSTSIVFFSDLPPALTTSSSPSLTETRSWVSLMSTSAMPRRTATLSSVPSGLVWQVMFVPLIPATAWLISISIVPSWTIFFTFTQMLPAASLILLSFFVGELRMISLLGFITKVDMSAKLRMALESRPVLTWSSV
ncbi:MAG: hypothetical protein BWY66_02233 [bacterium ADurb.Bin374]|nr:MAG: hypothetical protein BWY66_02233 [bacterium ADurb.Bin374]